MSLYKDYSDAIKLYGMKADPAQELVVRYLESLSSALKDRSEEDLIDRLRTVVTYFMGQKNHLKENHLNGLYLWGSVGRGKTWLMNMFYENLPIIEKKRIHFHHFMLEIHDQLSSHTSRKDPLKFIAKQISKKYRVLCIDEFIVTNITDAMILSELLHALFSSGVILVATSNRVPDDLYLNGLQRERFLPAIELIKTNTHVMELDGDTDHRSYLLERSDIYYQPVEENTDDRILQRMRELSISDINPGKILTVRGRKLATQYCSDDIAWFDFETICSAPRAAQDYIELAQHYNTIIITSIPVMDEYSDDRARRFIYLIDELYDRNVKLIASADAQPGQLYKGIMLEFAFNRTASRLLEMRSHEYFQRPHKPFLEQDPDQYR